MLEFIIEDIILLLGRNAQENWELLDKADPSHIWVHLDSFPSGYIIIQDDNPSEKIIREAGEICKEYSKYKKLKHIRIGYTPCKNLRKGDFPGEVEIISWRKYTTLKV